MNTKTVVKAKFSVEQVSKFTYGEVVGFKAVHAVPAEKGKEDHENTTYSKSIPAATLEMQINIESPDFGKLNPGDEVYVELTVAPKNKEKKKS